MVNKKKPQHRTEWLVNKMFTNRGWDVVIKNGRNVLVKRF